MFVMQKLAIDWGGFLDSKLQDFFLKKTGKWFNAEINSPSNTNSNNYSVYSSK